MEATGIESRSTNVGVDEAHLVFDTNAVRALTQLSPDRWNAFLVACRKHGVVAAWIPWVISEVTGSNLIRRDLTQEDLADLQHAVRRYDSLCSGRILPAPSLLMWRRVHEIAGVTPPEPPWPHTTAPERHRLDRFLCLSSPDGVSVTEDKDGTWVSLKRNAGDSECSTKIPVGFVATAESWIEILRSHLREHGETTRTQLAWAYFDRWLPHVLRSLDVPEDVADAALKHATAEDLAAGAFGGGLVEGWYIAGRALGLVSKVSENDARDIAITSYMSVAGRLVTRDRKLSHLLRELLIDPSRVWPFEAVLELSEQADLVQ